MRRLLGARQFGDELPEHDADLLRCRRGLLRADYHCPRVAFRRDRVSGHDGVSARHDAPVDQRRPGLGEDGGVDVHAEPAGFWLQLEQRLPVKAVLDADGLAGRPDVLEPVRHLSDRVLDRRVRMHAQRRAQRIQVAVNDRQVSRRRLPAAHVAAAVEGVQQVDGALVHQGRRAELAAQVEPRGASSEGLRIAEEFAPVLLVPPLRVSPPLRVGQACGQRPRTRHRPSQVRTPRHAARSS